MAKDFLSAVNQLLRSRASGVDSKRLGEQLLDEFGGVEGLAHEVKKEYDATEKGTTASSRLLVSILQLLNNVSAQHATVDPEKEMSTEELAAMLKSVTFEDMEPEEDS